MALTNDREKAAHLLRRFGLGASEAELNYYLQDGLTGAVDRLLNYEAIDEGFTATPEDFQNAKGQLNMPGLVAWWTSRLLETRRPLQEKMTLFWHDHFATSAEKVKSPPLMAAQNDILRQNATGNFQTLLLAVSRDPAMILWLDNQTNVVGKPNENFAREVMELFTLGIGHYTETDIQQAARAFTGWSVQRGNKAGARRSAEFMFRPRLHDEGVKTFFGESGNFTGEDIIQRLCAQPRAADYIVWKLWRFFGYEKPEPALVTRLAGVFRNANLEIKPLLRAMMTAPEFYSERCERHLFKNPADFVIATARQLGVGGLLQAGGPAARSRGQLYAMGQAMRDMGMYLFFPPDVAGWRGGADWVSTASMVKRMNWADVLLGTGGKGFGKFGYEAFDLFAADPSPAGVTAKIISLLDAPIPRDKVRLLLSVAEKTSEGRVTAQNANPTAGAITRLIFASPEFQFA